MVIAINAIAIHKNLQLNFYAFLKKTFEKIVKEHVNHEFLFIIEKNDEINFSTNNKSSIIKISVKNNLQLQYLLRFKIPQLLKKKKVDIVINVNEVYIALNTPQVMLIEGLSENNKKNNFSKVQHIICFSNLVKNSIIERYKTDLTKIESINIAPIYKKVELSYEKAMQVKDGFADGREYFLLNANGLLANEILHFLKAFSIFKKWQNSNMKLLLLNITDAEKNILFNKLETYKYKDDVVILNNIDETTMLNIIASCYCFVDINTTEHLPINLLQAINSGTSVISASNNITKEMLDDSILYTNTLDTNELAEQMKLIYKDENLRSNLIAKASNKISLLKLETTTQQLWNAISNLANK